MKQIILKLPAGFIGNAFLSLSEAGVLGRMLCLAGTKKDECPPQGYCYISTDTLADDLGISPATVKKARLTLKQKGLLIFIYNKTTRTPCWVPAVDLEEAARGLKNLGCSEEEAALMLRAAAEAKQQDKSRVEERREARAKRIDALLQTRGLQAKTKPAAPVKPAAPALPAEEEAEPASLMKDMRHGFQLIQPGENFSKFTDLLKLKKAHLDPYWLAMPEGEHSSEWRLFEQSVGMLAFTLSGVGKWAAGYPARVHKNTGRWDAAAFLAKDPGSPAGVPVFCRLHFVAAFLPFFASQAAEQADGADVTPEQVIADTAESYRAFYGSDLQEDIEKVRTKQFMTLAV